MALKLTSARKRICTPISSFFALEFENIRASAHLSLYLRYVEIVRKLCTHIRIILSSRFSLARCHTKRLQSRRVAYNDLVRCGQTHKTAIASYEIRSPMQLPCGTCL
jgi:hypothetical protein